MKKRLLVSLIGLVISMTIASITDARPNASFMNTIYTVAGIMFSIGMGIICTFNPDKIKNKAYFQSIKSNINIVRNSFLYYFALISIGFLIYQVLPSFSASAPISDAKITFSLSLYVSILITISIVYFILNFLAIQKLNFDISERINNTNLR